MPRTQTERLWIGGGAVLALIVTVIGYFFLIGPQRSKTAERPGSGRRRAVAGRHTAVPDRQPDLAAEEDRHLPRRARSGAGRTPDRGRHLCLTGVPALVAEHRRPDLDLGVVADRRGSRSDRRDRSGSDDILGVAVDDRAGSHHRITGEQPLLGRDHCVGERDRAASGRLHERHPAPTVTSRTRRCHVAGQHPDDRPRLEPLHVEPHHDRVRAAIGHRSDFHHRRHRSCTRCSAEHHQHAVTSRLLPRPAP